MRKPNNLVHKKTNVSDFSCCGWQLSPIDFDDVISSRLVAQGGMKVATGDMCGHHSKSCEFNQCSKPVQLRRMWGF
jgi:hypothetical protein